jgi:hypothetical protein
MPCAPAAEPGTLFLYSKWRSKLPELAREYRAGKPFPHICLPEFMDPEIVARMATEFPDPHSEAWTRYKHHNENKLGMAKRDLFPYNLGQVADELNSPEFVQWLSALTGISGLMPDPSLEGGGLHQSKRGGFLNVHTDFTMHHYHKNWRRRVNLILYVNPEWELSWGGAIELWDGKMKECVAKFPPLFNHALVFSTQEGSFHGFPEPLRCPEHVSRKSLALYYYTLEPNAKPVARSTDYRPRPGDGFVKSALIWLDKQAVDIYSRAKSRFGFSDEFASKVLGVISGDK